MRLYAPRGKRCIPLKVGQVRLVSFSPWQSPHAPTSIPSASSRRVLVSSFRAPSSGRIASFPSISHSFHSTHHQLRYQQFEFKETIGETIPLSLAAAQRVTFGFFDAALREGTLNWDIVIYRALCLLLFELLSRTYPLLATPYKLIFIRTLQYKDVSMRIVDSHGQFRLVAHIDMPRDLSSM